MPKKSAKCVAGFQPMCKNSPVRLRSRSHGGASSSSRDHEKIWGPAHTATPHEMSQRQHSVGPMREMNKTDYATEYIQMAPEAPKCLADCHLSCMPHCVLPQNFSTKTNIICTSTCLHPVTTHQGCTATASVRLTIRRSVGISTSQEYNAQITIAKTIATDFPSRVAGLEEEDPGVAGVIPLLVSGFSAAQV